MQAILIVKSYFECSNQKKAKISALNHFIIAK